MTLLSASSIIIDAQKAQYFVSENKASIIDQWVDKIRTEFSETDDNTDSQLRDHISIVLDFLIEQFQEFLANPENYNLVNLTGSNIYHQNNSGSGGKIHGRQRASIDAYNIDKVYREYIYLREILVASFTKENLLNMAVLQIVTAVIEHCTLESLNTFTSSVQRVQQKLLGSLVHDIRNPLNVLSITSEILSSGYQLDDVSKHVATQKNALDRISFMLEDMLSTISIEAGQGLDLYLEEVDLTTCFETLANDSLALYGPRFKYKQLLGDYRGIFDQQGVIRVVENIIANAFKYGDKHTDVTFTIEDHSDRVSFVIHNLGNPIAPTDQDNIFKFLRSDEGREKAKQKSWGIGLALSRATALGHNGSVQVSSNEKDGTFFTISLAKKSNKPGTKVTIKL